MSKILTAWNPEDAAQWTGGARDIARRNLWISIPALFLAFAVWMVWSAIVVKLPRIGFTFTTEQLFWLTALPGLSGATLRIFYSFMVPIFGGRRSPWRVAASGRALVWGRRPDALFTLLNAITSP